MPYAPKTVTIIGYGRFGQTLHRLLHKDFAITILDLHPIESLYPEATVTKDHLTAYQSEVIFYCIPINRFESTIRDHVPFITSNHTLIDVLSVKVHAKDVFQRYLYNVHPQVLLTHPLFGPDSSKSGFAGLPMVIDQHTAHETVMTFWMDYFSAKSLRTMAMTAEEHDYLAARSQGLTHFIGRILEEVHFQPTPIDTTGAQLLQNIKDQTCNDTWELFSDLQTYNPFTKDMRKALGEAYQKLIKELRPHIDVETHVPVYGIQGGAGSFNEEALVTITKNVGVDHYKVEYLYTTERVLAELEKGTIDYGLFAMHNSVGGIVDESVHACAKHTFSIEREFMIPIRHTLMAKEGSRVEDITTVYAHPQVFKQCKQTLADTYPQFDLKSGDGDLIDTAEAAKALAMGQLPNTTAILGSIQLASLYDFDILARDLQDDNVNDTAFLLVSM